jgi:hypothetical protein
MIADRYVVRFRAQLSNEAKRIALKLIASSELQG